MTDFKRHNTKKKNRRSMYVAVLISVIIIAGIFGLHHKSNNPIAVGKTPTAQKTTATNTASGFNKKQYSTTDPTSIWVVVNKQHPLSPKDYVPADLVVPNVPLRVPGNESMQLRKVTATAVETMFAAAKTQGINLMVSSGYRSYTYQVNLYNGYVQTQGQAVADTQSARPGFSEHQTGLALDVEPVSKTCEVEQCFGSTPEGEWVAANAYKYGFIVRYGADDQSITGYEQEPWHIRYIGTALAEEMHKDKIETLEQFFSISGGTTYTNN